MTRACLTGLGVVFLLIPPFASSQEDRDLLKEGVKQFHTAYQSWDAEGFLEAIQILEQASSANPDDHLPYHWLGVTWFHVLVHRQGDEDQPIEKDEFQRLSNNAHHALDKAIKLNEADSEAHALLATIAGMEIARKPARGIWRGPAVLRHRQLALRHGKDNPRTQYLVGAAFVRGPESLGGVKKGLPYLHRAKDLFEEELSRAEKPMPSAPAWGYEHCLVLIGDVYARLGDPSKAEEYFRKALTVNPDNDLAERRLNSLQRSKSGNE